MSNALPSAADRSPDRIAAHVFDVARATGLSLDRIIIFGSVARGTATTSSDTDIILVSDDFEGVEYYKRATDMQFEFDRKFGEPELIPVTPDEFATKSTRDTSEEIVAKAIETGLTYKRPPATI